LAGRCDRIVLSLFEQIDVVTPLQVIDRERLACQQLIKKPQPPGIFAGRFGPDIFEKIFLRGLLKHAGQDRQICPVIFECEFEMVAQVSPGQYLGG
jgi:hypothetical protein